MSACVQLCSWLLPTLADGEEHYCSGLTHFYQDTAWISGDSSPNNVRWHVFAADHGHRQRRRQMAYWRKKWSSSHIRPCNWLNGASEWSSSWSGTPAYWAGLIKMTECENLLPAGKPNCGRSPAGGKKKEPRGGYREWSTPTPTLGLINKFPWPRTLTGLQWAPT